MKAKIFPYPQNLVDFTEQSGDKLHDFRCLHRWASCDVMNAQNLER